MFSTNYKRINFIVEIQWDAKWANRMTEMKLSVVRGDV